MKFDSPMYAFLLLLSTSFVRFLIFYLCRCFLNINPDSGTKVSKAVKKKHQVFNAKVLTLLKGVADYEWVSK